jgi:hypothetical protein
MCPFNASVDVIALLKVDVFEQIPVRVGRRNRVPVHFDSGQMRDRALYGF